MILIRLFLGVNRGCWYWLCSSIHQIWTLHLIQEIMIVGEMRFACFSSYISSLRVAHHDVVKDLSHLKTTLSMFVFSAYHYLCSTKETFIQYFLEIYKDVVVFSLYYMLSAICSNDTLLCYPCSRGSVLFVLLFHLLHVYTVFLHLICLYRHVLLNCCE